LFLEFRPSAAMPKIAVAEDAELLPRKHNVRASREGAYMLAKAKSLAPEAASQQAFCFTTLPTVGLLHPGSES
jgi:hypothetical protein